GFQNVRSVTASIGILNAGTYGNLVLGIGAFLDSSLSEAQGFGAGSGWNLDGSSAASLTNDAGAILFESQLTMGNPIAAFSGAGSNEIDGTVGIAAVLLSSAISGGSGGGGGTGTIAGPFLGSITVVANGPKGNGPYLGEVSVVSAGPRGANGPY